MVSKTGVQWGSNNFVCSFGFVHSCCWWSLQEVDAVTAECLALREQVGIYEEQLANMEAQHKSVRKQNKKKKKDESEGLYRSSEKCLEIYLVQTRVVEKLPGLH